ncbi:metalloregulator ArsR/SmtB family transcription factor [Lachnoanaerobaculum sp. JCM 36186]|uniref:ArsR/SmtB family transcription factor n=1 Tax=Lachnoanaerobaculum TaxID=1164882 RepID=UPI00027A4213|nr:MULTISPECIES: metalloregulator ArsR/SmtB family transcription factor [unclassified Lachnoanaerobaculum]EJP19742.1 putative arsenical resistance operon repressor [Lachnoanaerobaculum sp. ICM7]GMO03076.1 metalloregulator ArsR/SmtB family transcription factor [Lachnoanaerobaculum sp. JCM 36186]
MKNYEENAKVFKALCDSKRLKIIDIIKDEEKCACVLLDKLDLSQSGLSYHMKILTDTGLINARQDGKWTHYSIKDNGIDEVIQLLNEYLK